jgi:hypothetical protein
LNDANDAILLRQVFHSVTSQVLNFKAGQVSEDQISQSDLLALKKDNNLPVHQAGVDYTLTEQQVHFFYFESFLNRFLDESPYREHLQMNFDDKIFFYEPDNKFFDLPQTRLLAWQQYLRVKHLSTKSNKGQKKQVEHEDKMMGQIARCYSKQNELRRTSTEFEHLMREVMDVVAGTNCTQVFRDTLQENPRIEHIIKQLTR